MAGDNRETGFYGVFFLQEQEAREHKKTAAWSWGQAAAPRDIDVPVLFFTGHYYLRVYGVPDGAFQLVSGHLEAAALA